MRSFVHLSSLGLLACGLLLSGGAAAAGDSRVPLPEVPAAKGDQCVEPTPVIRRNHMVFLKHQRDETMHRGIRTKRHSLKECIECHVQRDAAGNTIPVNAPGQFCQSCHAYAAVKMDCFQCHAATPDSGGAQQQTMQAGDAEPSDTPAHGWALAVVDALMAAGDPAQTGGIQ